MADAYDETRVRWVKFLVSETATKKKTLIKTDAYAPFRANWDTQGFDEGWYQIQLTVVDEQGRKGQDTIEVYVN